MATPETIQCQCPSCGYRWKVVAPANLSLFKTCPNPNVLPPFVRGQTVNGKPGRICRAPLKYFVFTLDPKTGAWAKPPAHLLV
jgi:hypothetical protein